MEKSWKMKVPGLWQHDHMLHRTGLLTEAQVRGSKATERLSNKKIQQSHTHTQTGS